MEIKEIANLKMKGPVFKADLTIKGYLLLLLAKVFEEGESFNSKKQFFNSGWDYYLFFTLAKYGLISVEYDEN